MGEFSASDAAVEGFNIIRARWRVVVGWGLFNLLALVGALLLTVGVALASRLAAGTNDEITAIAGGTAYCLAMLFVAAIFVGALYRLMLRPQEPGYLHLRVGRDEARLFVVSLIQSAVVLAIGVAASAAVGELQSGPLAARAACVLIGLALVVWLGARFCLLGPLSFVERRIDVVRAWRLTRGRTWPLIGMWLLVACLCGLVMVLVWLVIIVLTGALTGFGDVPSLIGISSMEHPGRAMLQLALQMLLAPAFLAIAQAPLMAAYRALADAPEPPRAAGESFGGPWG